VSAVAFSIVTVVALGLVAFLAGQRLRQVRVRAHRLLRTRGRRVDIGSHVPADPGAERRAERRARQLLRSIVNRDEWEMYMDLGFIRVAGRGLGDGSERSPQYGYLIYPHKPIVAFLPGSNSLLSEYCVDFPDRSGSLFGPKLPDSDDVLAKWMMIKADEERLIRDANMHLPGRQVDPQQVRRDLWRLADWERERNGAGASSAVRAGGVRSRRVHS
jgi:hypothetical protein